MELYFNVIELDKNKECIFNFTYVKKDNFNVTGCVKVDLTSPKKHAAFDVQSSSLLTDSEKQHIVTSVMRNICLGA